MNYYSGKVYSGRTACIVKMRHEAFTGKKFAGSLSGVIAEIADEMRLVIITAVINCRKI